MIELFVTNTFVVEDKVISGVLKTVRKRDDNNQLIPTNSLKVTTSIENSFPAILTSQNIKEISKQVDNLKFVANTNYRLASKEPTVYAESEQHSVLYKPMPKPISLKKW